tara:strand:+ start:6532 stop:7164 length:633 start_codon:yes stop_codon:yes gene_type:complete
MPDNTLPIKNDALKTLNDKMSALKAGEKSYVTPDTRGGGDVGFTTNNNFSLSGGVNLNPEESGVRAGASYSKGRVSTDLEYSKKLGGSDSFDAGASYSGDKGSASVNYSKNDYGKSLSASGDLNLGSLNISGHYEKSSEGDTRSASVRYGNRSGVSAGAGVSSSDYQKSLKGSVGYRKNGLSANLSGSYGTESGPSVSAGVGLTFGRKRK